jgi:hypothetical protein
MLLVLSSGQAKHQAMILIDGGGMRVEETGAVEPNKMGLGFEVV